jgi:putative redox protein
MSADTPSDSALAVEAGWVRVVETGEGKLAQHLLDGRHHLFADESATVGGGDRGPNPYELLLMALGACTAMTLRLYADRKRWPLARVGVRLRHTKIHAEDCAECETKQGKLDRIERVIDLEGAIDAAQRQRLLEIADMCPVHRTLTSEISIESRLQA